MSDERIPGIDGLRALAMVLVTAQHCGLAPLGWTGVWLFFVISGFVIARNFDQGAYAGATRGAVWLDFVRRRFWRIVPVYLVYVAVAVLTLRLAGRTADLHMLAGLLTFTYNWQTIFSVPQGPDAVHLLGHLWTLSVEEQFYLAFPLIVLLLGRTGSWRAALVIVLAAPFARLAWSAAAAGWSPDRGARSYAVYAASFAHFDAFMMGALLARSEARVASDRRLRAGLLATGLALLALHVAVYAAVNWSSGARGLAVLRNVLSGHLVGEGREALVYTAVNVLAASAVAAALGRRQRWLANPLLAGCGRISYGAYLVHGLVIWLAVEALGPVGGLSLAQRATLLPVVLVSSFALALVSWRWLEEPLRRWGTSRRRQRRLIPLL